MDFFTSIKIPAYPFDIHHQNKIIMVGSCFAEHIGLMLEKSRFQVEINPFGIMYNPVSIASLFVRAARKEYYTELDLVYHNNLFHCWDAHGSISHSEDHKVIERLNSELSLLHDALQVSPLVIITLGSAHAYSLSATNHIVANCHKLPQQNFMKKLLSVAEIRDSLLQIKDSCPGQKILFTVSPVRHWRDGAIENQRSKSHLFVALHQCIDEFPDNFYYFPSYELMMDELRDYRYYSEDMLHPNDTAVKYIFEQFSKTFFTTDTKNKVLLAQRYEKLVQHRPIHTQDAAYPQWERQVAQIQAQINTVFA